MLNNIIRHTLIGATVAAALCSGGTITIDTTPLLGHPAGPFWVYFAFTDGSGVNDANNSVTISNVSFGGGSSLGGTIVFGGASGSLGTGVTLTDTSFFSFFGEAFAPGLQLSFNLDLTSNDDAGGVPDRFTFFILDSSGVPLPTLSPAGDYFLGADLTSSGAAFDFWGSDPNRSLSTGDPVSIGAPSVTSSVPEPSTVLLLAASLALLLFRRATVESASAGTSTYRQRGKHHLSASDKCE